MRIGSLLGRRAVKWNYRASGSPYSIKDRIFACPFELKRSRAKADPPKRYPNPVAMAEDWQRRLETGEVKSRADLARQLGVSRAHVTQVLRLTDLAPCPRSSSSANSRNNVTQVLRLTDLAPSVKESVLALGDLLEGRIVGAHTLRTLARLPAEEQERVVTRIIGRG